MKWSSACSHPASCVATAIAISPYWRLATAEATSAGRVSTSHIIEPAATVLRSPTTAFTRRASFALMVLLRVVRVTYRMRLRVPQRQRPPFPANVACRAVSDGGGGEGGGWRLGTGERGMDVKPLGVNS